MSRTEHVFELIKLRPGITGPEIAKECGVTVNFLSYPLAKGVKTKRITRRRVLSERYPNIGQWAYFPA